jgi:A/G-specific adenine glycosylase
MAQQTQVARVLERYERWLVRWPTADALAAAAPADVLTEWVGLGYNRRALRLQAACSIVARDGWPRDSAGLRALPGVGPYTAAAVASFAFGERVAAVDTNVRRIAQRLDVEPAQLQPQMRHADWNQAAMELGARVCTARAPRCAQCPAAAWCPSRGQVAAAVAARGVKRPRFEDTDRWARGRVIAALAAGEEIPAQIAPERLARVVSALERDGLLERGPLGVGLPGRTRRTARRVY